MSSTSMSSNSFQSILDAAFESYSKQTGIDLTKHPSADKLQSCHSTDDVLQVLSERESAFKDYRGKYRNLIDCLRPVVQVVHTFSDVLREAAGLVRSGVAFFLSDCIFTPHNRYHFNQQKRYLSESMFSSQYVFAFLFPSGPYVIPINARLLRASVKAMMRLLTSLNASQISSNASIFIPRRFRCPLRCPISWSK